MLQIPGRHSKRTQSPEMVLVGKPNCGILRGGISDRVFTQYMLGDISAAGTILSISQRRLRILTPTKYKYRY